MPEPTTLGVRIARARHLAGLSQRELAARVGTSPSAVACWEQDTRAPSAESLCRIVAALECDPAELDDRLRKPDWME